ncbi:MAG: ABC transporter ATP-binding protein [Candidatus Riflebacteria bacterium]|nr:ABC transporter ATP-binding protein [Candidatus Riflebacteria bacterium]
MAFLEVQNVTMKFGSLTANSDVSFSVEKGSIIGLIGPNGAGKTTLFNCITGHYVPSAGKIFFDGKDISGLPPYVIARSGAVRTFQIVRPFKEMTVLENVMVGAFLRETNVKKARDIAERCLDLCHLNEVRDKPAGDLPIGNKKRLELARVLATGPKLLMLDEAIAGLTSTEVNEAVDLIRRLNRQEGMTILMVEHIMEAVLPLSDKVVVLDGGVKIAEGPPDKVIYDEKVIEAYFGLKFSQKLMQLQARGLKNDE